MTPLGTLERGGSLDVCRTREDVARAGHGLCVSALAPAMHPTGAGDSSFSRAAGLTLSRSHCRNIRQKISQWEGRTRSCPGKDRQQPRDFGVKYDPSCNALPRVKAECTENGTKAGSKDPKSLGLDFREDARSCWQSRDCGGPASPAGQKGEGQTGFMAPGVTLPPGNFYTSQALWRRANPLLPGTTSPVHLDLQRKRGSSGSTERELQTKGVDTLCRAEKSLRNIYSEVEGHEEEPAPDPPPKPRRTFRYVAEKGAGGRRDASATREAPRQKQSGRDLVSSSNNPEKKTASRRIRGRAQRYIIHLSCLKHFLKSLARWV